MCRRVSAVYSIVSACNVGLGVWENRAAHVDLSNMGKDCYALSPSLSPTTVYNVTVCFPHSVLLPSLCPPPLSLLEVSLFVFVSQWKPLTGLILEGNLLLYFVFVLFFFVKLMIHIVLEPPATIKTVKSCSGVCCIYCTICTPCVSTMCLFTALKYHKYGKKN